MGKKASNEDGPDIRAIRAIINTDIEAIQEDMKIEELVSTIIEVLVGEGIDVSRSYIGTVKREFQTFLKADPMEDDYTDALKVISKKLMFIKENPSLFLS